MELNNIDINHISDTFTEDKLCPEDCIYLNITEKMQNILRTTTSHICTKYNVRVMHGCVHPRLIKCSECVANLFNY